MLIATVAFAAKWDAVRQIPPDRRIEITIRDGTHTTGRFLSATGDALTFRDNSSTRSVTRQEIRKVRVYNSHRRIVKGAMWMAIGAAAGAGAGVAACPYCSNEGHSSPYIGTGAAAGAAIGALGFLSSPYRTVYKSK